jgi:hypothetical protein
MGFNFMMGLDDDDDGGGGDGATLFMTRRGGISQTSNGFPQFRNKSMSLLFKSFQIINS